MYSYRCTAEQPDAVQHNEMANFEMEIYMWKYGCEEATFLDDGKHTTLRAMSSGSISTEFLRILKGRPSIS